MPDSYATTTAWTAALVKEAERVLRYACRAFNARDVAVELTAPRGDREMNRAEQELFRQGEPTDAQFEQFASETLV